jgi:hypothetical protein
MSDYLTIGSTPSDEPCLQVGHPAYYDLAKSECRMYVLQLMDEFKKKFNREPACRLTVKGFPHDFGTYHEVCAVFNDNDEQAYTDALWFEGESSTEWLPEYREALHKNPKYSEAVSSVY